MERLFAAQGLYPSKACSAIPYRTAPSQSFTPKAVPSAALALFLLFQTEEYFG
jgi:hypothetical protein